MGESLQQRQVTKTTLSPLSPAERQRLELFNAFAFEGQGLGGAPDAASILRVIEAAGQQLNGITPAQRGQIQEATFGNLAQGFAPQLAQFLNQVSADASRRGISQSSIAGQNAASASLALAPQLAEAQRRAAELSIMLPFQSQQAGLQQAGALQGMRGQAADFASFLLNRDFQRQVAEGTTETKVYKKKQGFWSKVGAALGGAILGGFTGGAGTALAAGIGGWLGGPDVRSSILGSNQSPTFQISLPGTSSGAIGSAGSSSSPFSPTPPAAVDPFLTGGFTPRQF